MQDLTISALEQVTGGKKTPNSRPVSTGIDTGMIDFTRRGTSAPKVDRGMIDFTGQGYGSPKVDQGMIDFGGAVSRTAPIDYGPFAPRNMPPR